MKRVVSISVLLIALSTGTHAQVIDTTKRINTWQLMHNYTRFEEVPLDTNLHQLHRDYQPAFSQGFAYEYLGILGHGLNHVDFMLRPEPDAFAFGRGWDPYLKTASRTTFFNTRTPFTSLSYSTLFFVNSAPEENVEALHTQNLSPFSNFGIDFNILAGKPLYTNEDTRVNRIGLFASHAKDKYSIFGTFYYNNFNAKDHGGLESVDDFVNGTLNEVWEYPMQLTRAQSQYRNMSFFATQKYNLWEKQINTDSLGNVTTTGKTLSVSYQLHYDRHLKRYADQVDPDSIATSPVYDRYFYTTTTPIDSASEDKLSNVVQIILGDPDYDKVSLRAYAGYDIRSFGMLSPSMERVPVDSVEVDTIMARYSSRNFHDVFVGFHLAGPTTGIWDWVIDGQYYLLGYYQNDFRVNATFSRQFIQRAELGLRGSFEYRRPHYFTQSYSSSFFQWENDFPSMFRIKGEAFSKSHELGMDLRASVAYMRNYQYWDLNALPAVFEDDMLVISGSFSKHFTVSGFNSEDKVLVQYTTAADILPLPFISIYSSNYWKQSMFKGALIATLGFDITYTTTYKASAYMPATGVFHLQNESDVGGYPFLDVFLAFRIARTRIFVSYSNLLAGGRTLGNNYFTAYRYPMKPRNLRLGLVWTFYD